jgi:hypothetical protein
VAWETRRIERRAEAAVTDQFGPTDGANLWSLYVRAREKIVREVLPNIPGAEPFLTDHTQRHIENVLDNVDRLVGEDVFTRDHPHLNGADAYLLCLCVLFHDVGNVYGREGHERNIGKVYSWTREGERPPLQERFIVIKAAGAHSGKTDAGSRDTIADLPESLDLDGHPVHLQEIAAVLRFADELAEGPQRTSFFMHDLFGYPPENEIHHEYAAITNVFIDRGNGRIALTYDIRIDRSEGAPAEIVERLRTLLEYTFKRIMKLDQERQYARYYSRALEPFRTTTVQFNFWVDDEHQALDLEPLVLSDKRVPGDLMVDLNHRDPNYDVGLICERMLALLAGGENDA